jgi:hypothetical protein
MSLKIIFCALISFLLLKSTFAGSLVSNDPIWKIHTMKLFNVSKKDIYADMTIYLGNWNGTCVTGPSFDQPDVQIPANKISTYFLNGIMLKNEFGLQYSCAVAVIKTDKQTLIDTTQIFKSETEYTGSDPDTFYGNIG